MKRKLILVILCCTLAASGQKKTISQDEFLFEKAISLHELIDGELNLDRVIYPEDSTNLSQEQKIKIKYASEIKETILEKALGTYQELIDSFPKSKLVYRALNNKAFIEYGLKDYAEAKNTFLKILDSKANDKEKGGVGSGIMGEPYANYKNRAAKMLAEIAFKDSRYDDAIRYLDETKKYKYQHFCGNEYAADDIYMATMYGRCYLALNDDQKAYSILLRRIFENGLADNGELIQITFEALLKKFSKQDLRKRLEESFDRYYVARAKKEEDYDRYYIRFLDTEIEIDPWSLRNWDGHNEVGKENLVAMMQQSTFYKMLQ
jgi:hypothetical protein